MIYSWYGPNGKEELENIRIIANNDKPTIKLTTQRNRNEIPLLDTTIYIGRENYILTRMYHKPTDNKVYLYYTSAHP